MKISITVLPNTNTVLTHRQEDHHHYHSHNSFHTCYRCHIIRGVATHQFFPEGLMISQMARCRSSFCNLSCITQIGGRPIEEVIIVIVIKRDEEAAGFLQKRELHQTQIGDGGAVSRTHVVQCLVQRAVSGTHFNSIIHHRWAPAKDLCQSFSQSRFFLNAQYRYQIQSQYKCLIWTIAYIALYSFFISLFP